MKKIKHHLNRQKVKIYLKNRKIACVLLQVFCIVVLYSCKVNKEQHAIYNDPSVKLNPVYFVGILTNGDTIYYPSFVEKDVFYKHNGRYQTYKNGKLVRDIGVYKNKYQGTCFNYVSGQLESISVYHNNVLTDLFIKCKDGKIDYVNVYEGTNRRRKTFYNDSLMIEKEELYEKDSLIYRR
jgi:hypothetical protein